MTDVSIASQMSQLVYDYESLALKLGVGFLFSWVLCVGQLLEIIGQFNSAASTTALFWANLYRKRWKIILVITKIEAKKLAEKGLRFHTDLFTGKWKRRRYYLREDWDGNNIKLLNEIRGNKVK